jgi:nucleotide-binding universal stress UspA family protein
MRLVLVSAADAAFVPPPGRLPRLPPEHLDVYREEIERGARDVLAMVAADVGIADDAERRVVLGPASEALVEAARDDDATLIVVGSRGMGGLRSALLGSVSSSVLREADRPVVVVPAEARDRAIAS